MQAEHLRGTAGGSAELRDRDGGRVARQHGFRPAQQTQLPEEVAFERDVLRDGFDDERDLIEIPQTAHRPETLKDRVLLIGLHRPFLHGPVQPLSDPAQRNLERLRLGVEEPDVPPAGGRDLGDTAPHLAGAQHPNPRHVAQRHKSPNFVTLNEVKGLVSAKPRFFASLRMTSVCHALSKIIASASPPPMQRLANPRRAPRASIASRIVVRMRAPVAPMGWPKATAPPFTLTFTESSPSSRLIASDTDENASLISNRSMSLMERPVSFNTRLMASTGAIVNHSGARAAPA